MLFTYYQNKQPRHYSLDLIKREIRNQNRTRGGNSAASHLHFISQREDVLDKSGNDQVE